MRSGDLAFTIVLCALIAAWIVVKVVRIVTHHDRDCILIEPEYPEADAPPEVWVAYYDAVARSAEALATTKAPSDQKV